MFEYVSNFLEQIAWWVLKVIYREQRPHIIKEHCRNRIILRTDTYAKSLGYVLALFIEARKDFPGIRPITVDVTHYGGEYYKHTYGIEFENLRGNIIPESYNYITELETILA